MSQGSDRPLEPRRKAVVVGASSGIGQALARRLAAEGFDLGLVARRQDALEALAAELQRREGVVALAFIHDVRDTQDAPELLQTICRQLDGLDLFVYSAGVMYPQDAAAYDTGQDLETLEVNLSGAVAWINPVAQRFERAGGGHIVGIVSVAGARGRRALPAYSASKAGLATYLEAMRNRVSRAGVTVTTIHPGQVDTPMLAGAAQVRGPISVDRAAGLIWRAIRQHKQIAYVPWRWGVVALVIRSIPSALFRRLNL